MGFGLSVGGPITLVEVDFHVHTKVQSINIKGGGWWNFSLFEGFGLSVCGLDIA